MGQFLGSTFVGDQERRIRSREELIYDIVPTKTSAISEGAQPLDWALNGVTLQGKEGIPLGTRRCLWATTSVDDITLAFFG